MARHDPGLKADLLLGPALGAFPDCLRLCGATLCCNALGVPVCFC